MRSLALLLVVGCSAGSPATDERSASIIGGRDDPGDPAVVAVEIAGGACTGVLIAPTVVLTAAHCVAAGKDLDVPGVVRFGPDTAAPTATANVVTVLTHRRWRGQGQGPDLGFVRLAAPVDVAPIGWLAEAVALDGVDARIIGYGLADPRDPATLGIKREVTLPVRGDDGATVVVGSASANTCQGDSGGPALVDLGEGEGEVVVAVDSYAEVGCAGDTHFVRVDPDAALIAEVVAAWSGPCAADGICMAGCADPDCDPCGLEGSCADGCPRVDLDCPLGGQPGDACVRDADCEDRRCDDEAGTCAAPCGDDEACAEPPDGCGCATSGPAPVSFAMVLLILVGLRRRRGAAAATSRGPC